MWDLSNDTKKHTTKSRETIPLSGVNDTAEISMKIKCKISAVSLAPLKKIFIRHHWNLKTQGGVDW
jgi:hypothetical protein